MHQHEIKFSEFFVSLQVHQLLSLKTTVPYEEGLEGVALPQVKNYTVKSDGYGKLFECTNILCACVQYTIWKSLVSSELFQLSRILSAFSDLEMFTHVWNMFN